MNNRFTEVKEVFIEDNGVFDYVNLDKSIVTYNKITKALQKPLKLILFYGKPGNGKTFLLNKILKDLREEGKKIIFFPRPFFSESEFIYSLYDEIFKEPVPSDLFSYEVFLRLYKQKMNIGQKVAFEDAMIVLLDEAQLYPDELIEKIRLMADTRLFKFLFTVHKTKEEDVLAKDYFKTRIWESMELPDSTIAEIRLYIEKKLLYKNLYPYFNMYQNEHFNLIFSLSKGNLRTVNKLLYKTYEIYESYENYRPSEINSSHLSTKILEMAAIDVGLINA